VPLSGAAASAGLLRPWPGALDWRVALTLAATYASFGSGPAGAKAALDTLPPLVLVGVRGVVAGAVLVAWSLASGARCPSRHQWLASLVVGVLILALGAGGGTMGQRTVPSGVAGVMSALLPIFVAGLGLLLRPGGSDLDPFGVSLVVAGQLSWALGAELAPRVGLPEDPRLAAGAELLCGGAVLLAAAALMGDLGRLAPGAVSALSWLGLGWLTVTAVVGFTAYGFLARTVVPSVATTFSYVNPIVAMALGWLLFGEPLTVRMVLATAVVAVGVGLIVSAKSEAPARSRHPLTSGHGHRAVAPRGGPMPRRPAGPGP
jgi:drug/metabolite transporter (DMT)-like permease